MIPAFKDLHVFTELENAARFAQGRANGNGAPVGIWARDDGSCVVCEEPPGEIEPEPQTEGWVLWAIVEPYR